MKGIILSAGRGTRLYPMTKPVCKPLLPVYDKPLIYYSIDILLRAGIKDILIIIPPGEEETFARLFGDGSQLGVSIQFAVQTVARGIADAFIVGEEFIGDDDVCLILGDNIFSYPGFTKMLGDARATNTGATVFGYYVDDPRPFGVVEFDANGKAISIEEKPANPKSNYIIPGLYFYNNKVVEIAKNLKPSARGELEITDVNLAYLADESLHVFPLNEDFVWLDAGTADSLLDSCIAISKIQHEGEYVACIEKTAYDMGFIDAAQLRALGEELKMTKYGQYILSCVE